MRGSKLPMWIISATPQIRSANATGMPIIMAPHSENRNTKIVMESSLSNRSAEPARPRAHLFRLHTSSSVSVWNSASPATCPVATCQIVCTSSSEMPMQLIRHDR